MIKYFIKFFTALWCSPKPNWEDTIWFRDASEICTRITDIWEPILGPKDSWEVNPNIRYQLRAPAPSPPRTAPPPWFLGMTAEFMTDIGPVDKKLQGRILGALTEIARDPITPKGDTLKHLTGGLKNCWRYRIGDYRLIYSPNSETGNVALLSFSSRGSAYLD